MALPDLPAKGESPWYDKRQAFDVAVKTELEGRLSEAQLSTTIDQHLGDTVDPVVSQLAAEAVGKEIASQTLSYSLVWGLQVNLETKSNATTGSGSPAFTSPGRFGMCLSGGALKVGGLVSVAEPGPAESLTIEGWAKATAAPTGVSRRVLFAVSSQALYVAAEATTGYASVTTDSNRRWVSTTSICDGAWHHIAVTLTRNANTTTCTGFWIDGVAAANAPSGSPIAAAWNPAGVRVGGLDVSTNFDWYGAGTEGLLDEVRVSVGARYVGTFTAPTEFFNWDSKTLLLAHLDSTDYSQAETSQAYPRRPVGALGGSVTYVGPIQPTDWVKNDQWIEVEE